MRSGATPGIMPAMARVFVTRELPFGALDRLRAAHDVDVWPERIPPPPAALREAAADAEGLLTMLTDRVDADVLAAAPRLRAVANLAVGTDNIDLEAAAARGVAVGSTPDVLTDATADLALALLLAAARRLPPGGAGGPPRGRGWWGLAAGDWVAWGPPTGLGVEVSGATLGIVGWGRIGQAVARRAAGF